VTKRNMTPEEEQLWRHAMRDIMPMSPVKGLGSSSEPYSLRDHPEGRNHHKTSGTKKQNKSPLPVIRHVRPSAASISNATSKSDLSNLDRKEKQRVRRGKIEVDGKIDLHGLRQNEAHTVLIERIGRARLDGKRILLIVTGKGSSKGGSRNGSEPFWARGGGVLRNQVPAWLRQDPLRSMIFSVQDAHQRHGGGGALYVFLKRVR
jgi:DNA-nicking Smr family endonuclease